MHLKSLASGQPVQIDGELRDPLGQPSGWVEVASQQPIPLDEKLILAIVDPKSQELVRSLRPAGTLSVAGRFERVRPGDPEIQRQVQIELHNCTMRYERFPYPLSMINGTIQWTTTATGRSAICPAATTAVTSSVPGTGGQPPDGSSQLTLNFVGADVPLEDELREALSPGARRVWSGSAAPRLPRSPEGEPAVRPRPTSV